jgi:hypothetical protein
MSLFPLLFSLFEVPWSIWVLVGLIVVAVRDVFFNRHHTISHNFPLVGHKRYALENIGPELRQYIVANNREELPFNRSMGDNNQTLTLQEVFDYEKTALASHDLASFKSCDFLGQGPSIELKSTH